MKMKPLLTTGLLAAIFMSVAAHAAAFVENFDEAGTTWANTRFSNIIPSGGGTFERQSLSTALGAPNTSPALPVNAGGDLEGRYYEATLAATSSYAVTANSFTDATIDGYLGYGVVTSFGAPSMGFVLRESGNSIALVNGYSARIGISGPIPNYSSSGALTISRIVNGVVTSANIFATSLAFGMNEATENYHLTFSAIGSTLTASVFRIQAVGGALVETPIDLQSAAGVQSSITATDSALTSGAAGLNAFVRGSQSIFYDDISVVPEPASAALLGLGALLLAARRRRA